MEEDVKIRLESLENRIYQLEKNAKPKIEFPIVCAGCGKPSTVPFKPRFPSKLYCPSCYQKIKEERDSKQR